MNPAQSNAPSARAVEPSTPADRADRSRLGRGLLWLPGLVVALGAAVATAHGLFEVALAATVPAGIAWLYPLITDGLALVAYTATAHLSGRAARYAWSVVVLAAGLSGLAQAAYLASGSTLDASPALRFGVGAWPAVAAAIAAHLLFLLTTDKPDTAHGATEGDNEPSDVHATVVVASNGPPVQLHPALDGGRVDDRPAIPSAPRPDAPTGTVARTVEPSEDTPARARARAAALRHAARHGALPTVNVLADAAQVSRGTAATVLKSLRGQPLPLHLLTTSPGRSPEPDNGTQEHTQP